MPVTAFVVTLSAFMVVASNAAEPQENAAGLDCLTKSDAPLPGLSGITVIEHFAGAMQIRDTWFCNRVVLTDEKEDDYYKKG